MTPANVERLALLAGMSPARAYALAVHHEHADVRPWLAPLLVARVRRIRAWLVAERTCPRCASSDTRCVRADASTGGAYQRQCNTCAHVWEIHHGI